MTPGGLFNVNCVLPKRFTTLSDGLSPDPVGSPVPTVHPPFNARPGAGPHPPRPPPPSPSRARTPSRRSPGWRLRCGSSASA